MTKQSEDLVSSKLLNKDNFFIVLQNVINYAYELYTT